jgi:hypothetical protein
MSAATHSHLPSSLQQPMVQAEGEAPISCLERRLRCSASLSTSIDQAFQPPQRAALPSPPAHAVGASLAKLVGVRAVHVGACAACSIGALCLLAQQDHLSSTLGGVLPLALQHRAQVRAAVVAVVVLVVIASQPEAEACLRFRCVRRPFAEGAALRKHAVSLSHHELRAASVWECNMLHQGVDSQAPAVGVQTHRHTPMPRQGRNACEPRQPTEQLPNMFMLADLGSILGPPSAQLLRILHEASDMRVEG